nr:MAG TPA: hypothetical protein [Caudoviricetes sp.]
MTNRSRQTRMNLSLAFIFHGLIVPGKEDHVNLKMTLIRSSA